MRPPKLIERKEIVQSVSAAVNSGRHVALLGSPKSGKTLLLESVKRSLNHSCIHFSLKNAPMTPEFFTLNAFSEIIRSKNGDFKPTLDLETLRKESTKFDLTESFEKVGNELEKIKPNYAKLVSLVVEALKKEKEKILIIDDADELFHMENFSGVSEVLQQLLTDGLTVLLTSSHEQDLIDKISERCEMIHLDNFSKTEIKDLSGDEKIWTVTQGHPFLTQKLSELKTDEEISHELFDQDSSAYLFMKSWIDDALSRARGTTLPKAILRVIANNDGLRLSEIARLIYRPAPVTKSLIERLLSADIIEKTDKSFSFKFKPLARWYKVVTSDETSVTNQMQIMEGTE